jgi:hypothetical protein
MRHPSAERSHSMYKRLRLMLWIGVIGVLTGIAMAVTGISPKNVAALITAIGAGWIGAVVAAKLGNGVRDEMVVRVEHTSAYYTFTATLYLIFVLILVQRFVSLTLSIGNLLFALAMFMCITYLLLKYALLRRGSAE